jgi:hypothetical protein
MNYSHNMIIKKVSFSSFRHIRDLREVSSNEISIIKSETSLNNVSSDKVRVLNPITNIINYK